MKFAIYVRVSMQEQILENQINPLLEYAKRMGWEYELFKEKESTRKTRPIQWDLYNRLLKKEFDGVLIYKFDRWARSTSELVNHLKEFEARGIRFVSYSENIDLGTPTGKLMFTIIAAMAEFERELIRERTLAGLARARAQGKPIGRHPKNCGCGFIDSITRKKHDGHNTPIRNESNKVVGWKFGKTTRKNDKNNN